MQLHIGRLPPAVPARSWPRTREDQARRGSMIPREVRSVIVGAECVLAVDLDRLTFQCLPGIISPIRPGDIAAGHRLSGTEVSPNRKLITGNPCRSAATR